MALDVSNKPISTLALSKVTTKIQSESTADDTSHFNQPFPPPTAKFRCQNKNQTQNENQQKPLYYSIFDPPKRTLKPTKNTLKSILKTSKTPSPPRVDHNCYFIDEATLVAEIEQYDKDMYAAFNF